MLGAGLKKQWVITVAFPGPVFTQYSFPGGAVLSNCWIKVTKNDELVCSGNRGDSIFKVFIELVFCLILVGHVGSIGADDGSELL